jgi:hypothetical protein
MWQGHAPWAMAYLVVLRLRLGILVVEHSPVLDDAISTLLALQAKRR